MTLLHLFVFLFVTATMVSCTQTQPPPPSPIRTVATTKQLMVAITAPSDALFNVGAEPPASEDTWSALQTHAVVVAEVGNLLLLGDRLRDRGDWIEFSHAMTDAATGALEAAQSRDTDAASKAGDRLLETCSQCHQKYMQ